MYKLVIAELFLDNAEGDRNAIHLYISDPTPLEEKNLGKVFIILEFDSADKFSEDIVQRIDETFTQSFYHSADFEIEAAFERALQKVNATVKDLISNYGENWVYALNGVIGVMHGTELHFSYVRSMEAFMVQGNEIIDVIQSPKDTDVKPLKLFSNIISGQCAEDCKMLFSTSNLLDYLSLEKIRRVVQEHDPLSAVTYFEGVLTEQTALSNIAGIIVASEKSSKPASPMSDQTEELKHSEFGNLEDSMSKLSTQEQQTDDLLAPSIWPTLRKRVQTAMGSTTNKGASSTSSNDSLNYGRAQNKFLGVLLMIGNFLKNVGIQILVGLSFIGKQIARLFNNRDAISHRVGGSVNGATGWFGRLSKPRKILLFACIALFSIFMVSVFAKNRTVEKEQIAENYEDTLIDVENQLGEVESRSIMNDESGARSLVIDATDLLNTVPADDDRYIERIANLRGRIQEYDNRFNKVTVVNEPTFIGNFSDANNQASVVDLVQIGDNIFGFDSDNNSVYRINLGTNTVSEVVTGTGERYSSVENDSVGTSLALTESGEYVQFNPILEKTSSVTVASLPEGSDIKDIDIFGSRLYTLDSGNDMIYRQQQSGENYGSATEWLTEEANLSSAVAFDIDSSIYVLFADGSIKQYDGGSETAISID